MLKLKVKPYLPAKYEVCRCYGSWVSVLQPDYEKEEEHGQFATITFTNITHMVQRI